MRSGQMVDVPSNQQRCLKSSLLMRTVQQDCFESFLVDVPSQQRNCLESVIFVAQVHHGIDRIYSNGGRAEI